ncbi:rRNA 2'-O-methyltransferase fibrillarin 1-like [Apium graveolens]|uniref:rRNA 2'-O-methyltransferase fibrillarin 1-like n=1 Tax=Apium graveolens TaxID=4045 RepID=UPI003D7BE3C5
MRGLRAKIDKFIIDLEPGDLRMAQLNLARSYRWQSCACKESSIVQINFHTGFANKVVVVPHKFKGLFIAKGLGKKNFICTKNLVPGKVLHGDKLISVQKDDGTEVEYRLWHPHMSKLAAAILGGLTNIWIKPGSHVLYLGDVCGITVLQLSDLVGSNGMVYVIGLSDVVANTVEERSNVVTFPENFCFCKDMVSRDYRMVNGMDYSMVNGMDYRMVVGMVDVILGDIVYPDPSLQVNYIARYALVHLKTAVIT